MVDIVSDMKKIVRDQLKALFDIENIKPEEALEEGEHWLSQHGQLHQNAKPIKVKDKEDGHSIVADQALLLHVIAQLEQHRHGMIFDHPVTEREAPGYSSIIQDPVDLHTLKKKIRSGQVSSSTDLYRSLMQMCDNALIYNKNDEVMPSIVSEMRQAVCLHIKIPFVNPLLLLKCRLSLSHF